MEWKIAPQNSSGIFYHVQKDYTHPFYDSAPEYEVSDDKDWPERMETNQYSAGSYAMYAPEGAVLKPFGEWNNTKIIVKYPHVEHWLNGVKVVDFEIESKDWKERKSSGKWENVVHYGKFQILFQSLFSCLFVRLLHVVLDIHQKENCQQLQLSKELDSIHQKHLELYQRYDSRNSLVYLKNVLLSS